MSTDGNDPDNQLSNKNDVYLVGVSGGKDSSAVLLWMMHESGVPRSQILPIFCDTGNEHELTIKHIGHISSELMPVTTISGKRTFYDLAIHRKRFPSVRARFCTEELKIYPTQDLVRWLTTGGFNVVSVSGVRADESTARGELPERDYSGTLLCDTWRPLLSWTINDVYAIHTKYDFPLNPLYGFGARRVGCWPCIMSNKAEIRNITLNFPDQIKKLANAEAEMEAVNGKFSGFFASDKIPPRFRTQRAVTKNNEQIVVACVDDVSRWSLTGHRARGHYLNDPEPQTSVCNSGFCE